jgi:PAS domain S-box-containing protein
MYQPPRLGGEGSFYVDETQEQSRGRTADGPCGPDARPEDAELWLAALVNSSDDAIISKTLDGVITSWNAAAQRIYGYAAAEMIGQPIARLIPPERLDEFNELMRRLREGERIDPFETVRVHRDGTRIHISLTISPIINAHGQIIGASTIGRDITARKQAEIERERLLKELEESRRLFQRIAETSPDNLYVYDFDTGHTMYFGAHGEQVIGYTAEQVMELGDHFAVTFWHPDDLPSLPEHRRKLQGLADGEIYECEYRIRQPDGAYRWLRSRNSAFARADDEHVQQIIGVTQDVTVRKKAEEHLAYQALLLENVHDAIVAADERLILTAWNRAAEKMYGWTAAEVIGRDIREVVRSEYPEAQRAEAFRILAETGRFSTEVIHHRRDGSAFWIEGDIIALRNEAGQVTGYLYAFHDITERKQAEEELRRAHDELELRVAERTRQLTAVNEALM